MTNTHLPQTFDPIDFVKKRQRLSGVWVITDTSKLSEYVVGESIPVSLELKAGKDEQGYAYLRGTVKAEVTLLCQRCLEPMTQMFSSDFSLSPVKVGEESSLPEVYEALVLDTVCDADGQMSLGRMIEEELLLGLPLIPKHDWECREAYKDESDVVQKANPFAVLANRREKQ